MHFTGRLPSVAFSPDGTLILTGGIDSDITVQLMDAQTGNVIRTFPEYNVSSAVYSSDGHQILTGGEDKTAKLWDAQIGNLISTFLGQRSPTAVEKFANLHRVHPRIVAGRIRHEKNNYRIL